MTKRIAFGLVALLAIASCGSDSASDSTDAATATTTVAEGLDPNAFFDGALVGDVATTGCTLSNGDSAECYELTVVGFPANRDAIGPWCPATISDGAAGIWFDGSDVYDIDGQFILDLATIYDDPTWQLYDEEGNVLSTDTAEVFNELVTGAPQADPDAGPVNLCVYGEIEWLDGGQPISTTVEIPITPILAESPNSAGTIGVTLSGVPIASSAPIDLILGNYTIGAFDPCGGHVNPQEGYHIHATTGCSDADIEVPDGETALFAYALDGFGIHAPYEPGEEPEVALDQCNGHETDELGYHYHANDAAQNEILPCFSGETATSERGRQPPEVER